MKWVGGGGLVLFLASSFLSPAGVSGQRREPTGRAPVLVELFTSEGCSSCPPADALLSDLQRTQPVAGAQIIVLSEHVDYWNRLGWQDPFSSSAFSARQSSYAQGFGTRRIYTPQMVVDGQVELVGSDAGGARRAIAAAARSPKAEIQLSTLSGGRSGNPASYSDAVLVRVMNLPPVHEGDTAEVWFALVEDGLRSDVRRGENAGRKLMHDAVVRRLDRIGTVGSSGLLETRAETGISDGAKPGALSAVAFIQENRSRRILGVARLALKTKN